jgi:Ca2+-binding RTX toxin-like protein
MKRLALLVLVAALAVAAFAVGSASAVQGPRTETGPPEKSINIVLDGTAGDDHITIELSVDGRTYEIDSATPLEVASPVCSHPEKTPEDLVCEAAPIAGFEVNTGAGNDSVALGARVPVPATIRGGEGDDTLIGGAAADKLIGGPGNDELIGRGGNDVLIGGPGDDVLNGGPGNDILQGGPGHNTLIGGPGKNIIE